ncbi:hypothetical protein MR810_01640 [bacterium]|nr:hypothetical protein [bacterium]
MKKIVCIMLMTLLLMPMFAAPSIASEVGESKQPKNMDNLDIIVSAYLYVGGIINTKDPNTTVTVTKIVPLYDLDGQIVAYYVVFSPGGYAVVNNNVDNPTVLEFGEGEQQKIEGLLTANNNERIVYNNPTSVCGEGSIKSIPENKKSNLKGIYEFYPDLSVKNEALASQLLNAKAEVVRSDAIHQTRGDRDFGFFNASDMPTGNYTSDTITAATQVDWAIMNDYNDIASRHCGATAVTNLALYFAQRGRSNLKINNSKRDTYVAVHGIVNDGPTLAIAGSATTYFSNRGYSLNHSGVGNAAAIKTATTNNRPCGILLADGLFAWHWIIGVGWRQYSSSDDFYIRINNNWDNTVNIYYKPGTGSLWWSATSYWVS